VIAKRPSAEVLELAKDLDELWQCAGPVRHWSDEDKRSFIHRACELAAALVHEVKDNNQQEATPERYQTNIPLKVLQARAEKLGVIEIIVSAHPGGWWSCDLRTFQTTYHVEPVRSMCAAIDRGLCRLADACIK